MSIKLRSSFLSLAIIVVLLFGAMSPTVAYADEGVPPDSPPTEISKECSSASGECSSDAEATDVPEATETSSPDQATAEPVPSVTEVPTEATPVGEGDTPTEEAPTPVPTEEPALSTEETEPVSDSNILEEVPADTTVTVLNADGQVEPLVTQAAADAIAELDPIWCPQGQAPTPGTNGCTPSFNNFKALLTFLSGNADYQGAGTIYIQEGVYISGGANDFNLPEYDLSNIRNSDLTITGGWNPTTGTVDSTSTSSFRIPLLIGTSSNPWGGSISINNLTIDKSDGTSLVLYTDGDIRLDNVNITNAHNNGAGAELNAGGDVNIANSNFIRNKKAGAIIKATGNVAIFNSSFSNPTSGRQQITGLDIVSGGAVNLASVTANGNREVGANINAGSFVAIANSFFSGNKSMKGSGPSRTFWGYGLQVATPGDIAMANVTANDNFLWGASLQAGGDVTMTDSIFNANTTEDPHFIDDTGLIITSGGNVTLHKIEANDNRLIGASIRAVGDVNIDSSSFSNNRGVTLSANRTPTFQGYGLSVITQGRISLVLVNASNNTLFGAHLEAGGDVDISESHFDNQTSGSATDQIGRGLEIISGDNVFLAFVSTNNNQTFGSNIQAANNIFIDTVTATNNGGNGMSIETSCNTTFLFGGSYANNGGYGLSFTNTQLRHAGSTVFGGNGAGDIFQDPGSCNFTPPATPGNNNTGGTSPHGRATVPSVTTAPSQQTGSTLSNEQGDLLTSEDFPITRVDVAYGSLSSPGTITLNIFLAAPGTPAMNLHINVFAGKYVYTYTPNGIQVVVFDFTSPGQVALNAP